MADDKIYTRACDLLGIEHPIVQTGMAGLYTSPELVAAVSDAGALGVLGCLNRSAEQVVADIRRIRELTSRPFGVNFVLHLRDDAAFEAALAEGVPVFSFFRGDPQEAVMRAHAVGAVTMHQITTPQEAARAVDVGVDVLVAQGHEAGGHNGPIPLAELLPQVLALAGERPVLAAGGLVDGRNLAWTLAAGAALGRRATTGRPFDPGAGRYRRLPPILYWRSPFCARLPGRRSAATPA
jgi:NAD(P)H-dependent flavin oxidoreductase YrpB (nitropropane dioxygenase family)